MSGWSERIRTHAFPIEPGLCVSIREFGNMAEVDRAPCAAIPARQTEKPDCAPTAPPTLGALGDAPHVSRNVEPIRSYARNPPVSAETLEWNKTSSFELRVKKSGGSYGSDNALPEMRKANGSGVTISGRTDFQCIGCDDPAVKWAESSPTVPEKPIIDNGAVICVFETPDDVAQ
jgi:hypothetical protein